MNSITKLILCAKSEKYLPEKMHESLFFDFKAAFGITLDPGQRALVPTGCKVAMPNDCFLEVRPRSGMALNDGVTILNTPGTVDSDYRGDVGIILINLGKESVHYSPGDRIAQARFVRYSDRHYKTEVIIDDDTYSSFDTEYPSARAGNGFGSTGS